MRLKLPAFKVTQRTAASSTVRRNLPRGRKYESAPAQSSSGIEEGVPDFVSMMEEGPHACSVPEVSLHAVKEKAAATAWARVRPALLKIAVEGNAMPLRPELHHVPRGSLLSLHSVCTLGLLLPGLL